MNKISVEQFADLRDMEAAWRILITAQRNRKRSKVRAGVAIREIVALHGKGRKKDKAVPEEDQAIPEGEQAAWDIAMQGRGLDKVKIYVANCRAAALGQRMEGPGTNMSHNALKKGAPYPRVAPYHELRPLTLVSNLKANPQPLGLRATLDVHSASMREKTTVWASKMSFSLLVALAMLPPNENGDGRDWDIILMPLNNQINLLNADISEGVAMIDVGTGCNLALPEEARRELKVVTNELDLDQLELIAGRLPEINIYGYLGARTLEQCLAADLPAHLSTFAPIGPRSAKLLDLDASAMALDWDPNGTHPSSPKEFVMPLSSRRPLLRGQGERCPDELLQAPLKFYTPA